MARTIPVSFKDNKKDNYLYEEVQKHGDKSDFVKKCIEFYLKNYEKDIKIAHLDNR